ncbi:MAG TPA: carboxypeptidase regulatory-like domain-containing protein [Nocardioides sp.]|uniref:carboxypeptidase regulatory-like domain-containing protein n=1 Tax=Nocardioides sp. TaxID=35761 RepID=UPI002EDB51A9
MVLSKRWWAGFVAVLVMMSGVGLMAPAHAEGETGPDAGPDAGTEVTAEALSSLSGTVTDSAETPLADVTVAAYEWSSVEGSGYWTYRAEAATDADGRYELSVAPGVYSLRFDGGIDHLTEWLGDYDSDTFEPAYGTVQTVTVSEEPATVGATQLTPAATFSGTVTAGAENVCPSVQVERMVDDGWTFVSTTVACDEATGTYTVGGLPDGQYRVFVEAEALWEGETLTTYVGEYYDDAYDASDAITLSLAAATPRTGIDLSLVPARSISGRVTGPEGEAVPNADVTVYSWSSWSSDPEDGFWFGSHAATTGPDGTYQVNYLAPGTYRIGFSADGLREEFHDNAATVESALDVEVDGADVANIDAQLTQGATISGSVTSGTTPVADARVELSVQRSYPWGKSWESLEDTSSVADGGFSFGGLEAGTYRVCVTNGGDYVEECWDNAASTSKATPITVAHGATRTGIALDLALGGTIAGTIENAAGEPLASVSIPVWQRTANGTSWTIVDWGWTLDEGTYRVSGLPAGSYRVGFNYAGSGDDYVSEYFDDQPSLDAADDLVVTAGVTTSADATLARAATLTGKVLDAQGEPLGGVSLDWFTQGYSDYGHDPGEAWHYGGDGTTNWDGAYTITSVTPGPVRLGLFPHDGVHMEEYYDGAASVDAGDDVMAVAGESTAVPDVTLARGGTISGQVTASDAPDGLFAHLELYRLVVEDGETDWSWAGSRSTDSAGQYTFTGLATGSYRIHVYPSGNHLEQYYGGSRRLETATTIEVAVGQDVTGKDVEVAVGGIVSGTVTGNGTALEGARVDVFLIDDSGDGYDGSWSAWTSPDGSYAITNLPPGDYKLLFDGAGPFVAEYWRNKSAWETATAFSLGLSATRSAMNADLASGATIAGTVTADGAPVVESRVRAYLLGAGGADWVDRWSTWTEADGSYELDGLPAGEYKVRFEPTGPFAGEYWEDQDAWETADDITLALGDVQGDLDADLERAATVTGVVTGPGDEPVEEVEVCLYEPYAYGDETEWDTVDCSWSGTNGSYAVEGLESGTYRIGFYTGDADGDLAGGFYSAAGLVGTIEAGADVVLTASQTLTLNQKLAVGGAISGQVSQAPGADSYGDGVVTLYDQAGKAAGSTYAYDGEYTFAGVPAGSYKVGFARSPQASDVIGAAEFYQDKVETVGLAGASPVVVKAGETTSGIDAVIETGGRISGTLTKPVGTRTADCYLLAADPQGSASTRLTPRVYEASEGTQAFAITGLNAAGYQLRLECYDFDTGEESIWYYDAQSASRLSASVAAADVVTVPALGQEVKLGALGVTTTVIAPTGAPTINGTAAVGQRLTVATTSLKWAPADVVVSYQWKADGALVSTNPVYTVKAADLGKQLSVVLAASKAGYTGAEVASTATAAVAKGTIAAVGAPAISGTAQVGSTLTANEGNWSPSAVTTSVSWSVAGVQVATGPTYQPGAAEAGKTVTITVVASREGYHDTTATSAATAAIAAADATAITHTGQPGIAGVVEVGQTVEVDLTGLAWTPADAATAVTWLSDGAEVGTGPSYAITADDLDNALTVVVLATKAGHVADTATSPARTVVKGALVNLTKPAITGTAKVGQTLTASPGTWDPAGVQVYYEWYADDEWLENDGPKLLLTADHIGKAITVEVLATRRGYHSSWAASPATALVGAATPPPTPPAPPAPPAPLPVVPPPAVKGKAQAGKKLSAATVLPAGVSGKVTYTWTFTPKKKGKKKPKPKTVGKSSSLKMKKQWKGGKISVTAVVTLPDGQQVKVTSKPKKVT